MFRQWFPEWARAAVHLSRNTLMRWMRRSDHKRWGSDQGLQPWWDERTLLIASLVPDPSRVIEFGAGRRQLEKALPASCTYTPSDLTARGAGTVVCDLNLRPFPDLSTIAPEVAVFGGVLEYISDVPAVLRWLAKSGVETCVASFDPAPEGLGVVDRSKEWARRRYNGYMNSLTENDFLRAFEAAGFGCAAKRTWKSQFVFQFQLRRQL